MATTIVRRPAVAGRFYPGDPDDLRAEARGYLSETNTPNQTPVRALGCIAPHAGYVYSGHVAGAVFARVEVPRQCVVMCPNHTGMGRALAVMSEGAWETPLGDVPIDHELAEALKGQFPALQEDAAAHRAEHAAEVELPFLLLRQPELRFVPIALGTGQFEALEQLGKALAHVIAAQKDPVLIVASSDMNHYESDTVTRAKDHRAIERILTLDPRGTIRRGDATGHQHVRIWSGGGDVDSCSRVGSEVSGTGEVRDLGGCVGRPRHGCGVCGHSSRLMLSCSLPAKPERNSRGGDP